MTSAQTSVGYPRKRERTRRRLLRAGLSNVAEKGPAGISAGAIASEAGLATGTFYNHFPTVEEFLDAIAHQVGRGIEIGRATLAEIEHDPAARVAIGVLQLLQMADTDPLAASTFVKLVGARPDFRSRVRMLVTEAINDGVDGERFDVEAGDTSTNAVLGSALQSMRSLILGEITHEEATDVTALILRLLGVKAQEIEVIVTQAMSAVDTTA